MIHGNRQLGSRESDLPFAHFRHLSFATDTSQSQCKPNRMNRWKENGFIRKQELQSCLQEEGGGMIGNLFFNFCPPDQKKEGWIILTWFRLGGFFYMSL